jgi:two-component system alkaline phosphatase synthesis response regulator PhoP
VPRAGQHAAVSVRGAARATVMDLVRTEKRMPSKILIADDNQANCELLDAYLSEVDCQVETASDGQETLDKIASFQPDLILLDVMMPKLSGFEVCKKIKEDPQLRRIMVLMVTALNEPGDIERAVASGTDDFLSKPVQKIELLKRVENMLKLKDVGDENERLRQYIEQIEAASGPRP